MGAGKQLRQAREALGLTVRDIAERTKIPSRQIEAIETEHYEKLPGGIFGRGYVRAVAAALKLDADAIVEAYRDETEAERTAIVAPTSIPQHQSAELERAITPPPWREDRSVLRIRFAPPEVRPERAIAGLVAALLLGLGAVMLILWLGRDRGPAPAPSQPVARAPGVSVPPGQRDQAVGTAGSAAELRRRARPAEGGAALRLQAERACWLSLTVDGERIAHRMMQPGDVVQATMKSNATVRTGDAGALRLAVNGAEARPLGPAGAVRTVELTPGSIR